MGTTAQLAGATLTSVSAELAALMANAHSVGSAVLGGATSLDTTGLQRLSDAVTTHLGGVLVALRRHGYPLREDWDALVRRLCTSQQPTLLHGDLGGGNVVRDADDGQLRILDSCGYIGPPEFDAARWAARTGGATKSEDVLSTWLANEPGLDEPLTRALLGLELLMEAGVRELVKDEQHQPLNLPDAITEQLLATTNRLLNAVLRRLAQ